MSPGRGELQRDSEPEGSRIPVSASAVRQPPLRASFATTLWCRLYEK